jgi:hypothetical protein
MKKGALGSNRTIAGMGTRSTHARRRRHNTDSIDLARVHRIDER